MANIILAILVFAPALFVFFLKSNAAISFLTLCGSFVLITFANADIKELTGHLDLHIDASVMHVILLIFPLLLSILLNRKAFSGQLKTVLHLITALCTGGLLALSTVPLLSTSLNADFSTSWGWMNIQKIQAPIIATGVLLSFFLVWFGHLSKKHKHHK